MLPSTTQTLDAPVPPSRPSPHPDVPFRDFVAAHQRALYALALDLTGNHHDAEDLSQEVFVKAYRARDGFRGDASALTWLRRIAINTYLNTRRKKAVTFMRFFGDFGERQWQQGETPAPDAQASGRVLQGHIEGALRRLSPRERTAFVLRHYQELSMREVAEAMEVAEGTAKSLLFRATRKLRDALAFCRTTADRTTADRTTADRSA